VNTEQRHNAWVGPKRVVWAGWVTGWKWVSIASGPGRVGFTANAGWGGSDWVTLGTSGRCCPLPAPAERERQRRRPAAAAAVPAGPPPTTSLIQVRLPPPHLIPRIIPFPAEVRAQLVFRRAATLAAGSCYRRGPVLGLRGCHPTTFLALRPLYFIP